MDERKVKVAAEKHSITERWDMWDQGDDDKNKTKAEREDRRDKDKKERQKGGEVFDKDAAILDMSKLRVTDIPTNTRVFEPRAASGPEEVKIQVQKDEVMRTCKGYTKKECNENGGVKKNNLTAQQIVGKLKLQKRVRNEEIVIFPTDKSGKLAITTPEIYQEAAKIHVDKDTEVPWETLKEVETKVNRHVQQLTKAFSMGTTHGQSSRINKAFRAVDVAPPVVYFLWKDHKPYDNVPPTRPVCGGHVGPLTRASELVSSILTPIINEMVGEEECQSSEEMQRAVEDANVKMEDGIQEDEELVIFSQDVIALYPSLDIDDITESVRKAVMDTKVSFKNIDMETVGKYLAIHMTKEEQKKLNIVSCIPDREGETKGGTCRKVTIAYLDTDYVQRKNEQGKSVKVEKWS